MSDTVKGIVTRATGSRYLVQTADGPLTCTIRGKFRMLEGEETNPVVIGDEVEVQPVELGETGVIVDIDRRRNQLTRRAAGRRVGKSHVFASNIDGAWVVQSVQQPKLNPGLVDRFLIMAEAWEIPAGIIINKMDLIDDRSEEAVAFWKELYQEIGYPVLSTSTVTGEGIETFREALAEKVTVLIGPSGTGKSSLINAAEPKVDLRTGAVSEHTSKGKHTTTFAELVPIKGGGYVGDTPGIREFGLFDIEPAQLSHFFVEYRPYIGQCRFPDCTHDHEPGCVITELIDQGRLSLERYHSYLSMLESLKKGDKDVGR